MVSPINPVQVRLVDPSNQAQRIGTDQAEQAGTTGFGRAVGNALDSVAEGERTAEAAAQAAAVGDLSSVSDYMIVATEAQLATEITVAVRDRAISAFNDIMRMQV